MRPSALATILLAMCFCLCLERASSLRPIYQDVDSQYGPGTRDLSSWLMEWAQRNDHAHKRNSEIINSLLGLPRNLNDAGRK